MYVWAARVQDVASYGPVTLSHGMVRHCTAAQRQQLLARIHTLQERFRSLDIIQQHVSDTYIMASNL